MKNEIQIVQSAAARTASSVIETFDERYGFMFGEH